MTTATKIKMLRKAHHMNQMTLSSLLNVSQQTLSQYENGQTEPSLATFTKLCRILHVSADELLGLSDDSVLSYSPEDKLLLEAYQNADDDTKTIVQLALKRFMPIEK